jgi:dTDP-4-amino-4,6-dideoxygalactose transaminase
MQTSRFTEAMSKLTRRSEVVFAGRGATCLYGLFRVLRQHHGPGAVIFPATLCMSPVCVAIMAGLEPLFVDVDQTGLMDPESVRAALEKHPAVLALLVVHLYGRPAPLEAIRAIAGDVLVIEDAAQSLGGQCGDQPMGSQGHVSLLSFGHTKILDLGGGGLLALDDAALAHEVRTEVNQLAPVAETTRASLSQCYRDLYYALWDARQVNDRCDGFFKMFPHVFGPLYLTRDEGDLEERILSSLPRLDGEVTARREKANLYRSLLQQLRGVRLFPPLSGESPWRFSFRLPPTMRDRLLSCLRQQGFDASSWYPPLHRWFGRHGEACPEAQQLSDEIVNLWVTAAYSQERIRAVAETIEKELEHVES